MWRVVDPIEAIITSGQAQASMGVDQEKFFIDFTYQREVAGNLEDAYRTLELWRQTYPRDWGVRRWQKMAENVSNLKNTSICFVHVSGALLVTCARGPESTRPNP